MKTLREMYKLYKAYRELKKIRSRMSQIEYYIGVEKDNNPRFFKKYDQLIEERRSIINGLSWI